MRMRYAVLLAFALGALAPGAGNAAKSPPPVREVWSGAYQCGPILGGDAPAYSSRINMLVEDGAARIDKESAQIRESFSGQVAPAGTLKLEGSGARKDGAGAGWRYSFEGRFDGDRFDAKGAMLSATLATRLRDCSITLRRVQSSASPLQLRREELPAQALQPQASAPAPVPPLAPVSDPPPVKANAAPAAKSVPPVVAEALIPMQVEPGTGQPRPAGSVALQKELDFEDKDDTATMEGTVYRGVPHRYLVTAAKGQALTAKLKSEGARFDLYEPGSTLTMLSSGFVVQGARLGATSEGAELDLELPADGKYLLLVRASGDQAFYRLELGVKRAPSSTAERWYDDKKVWIAALLVVAALAVFFLVRRKRDRRIFSSK